MRSIIRMDYVNQDLSRLYARLGLQQQIPYVSSGNVFFNGELEMNIVCILGICFPSKRQVPIDVAVTAHQVPNCIQLEQCEQSFLLKETGTKFANPETKPGTFQLPG